MDRLVLCFLRLGRQWEWLSQARGQVRGCKLLFLVSDVHAAEELEVEFWGMFMDFEGCSSLGNAAKWFTSKNINTQLVRYFCIVRPVFSVASQRLATGSVQPGEFLRNREYSGRVYSCATAAHWNNGMGATYLTLKIRAENIRMGGFIPTLVLLS